MKLVLKQRLFSWFDSYDVCDEYGNAVFSVKGRLAWGHLLEIYDNMGNKVGVLKEKVLKIFPTFEIYIGGEYMGCIKKEFTFFKPKFHIDFCGWRVDGDIFGWDYSVYSGAEQPLTKALTCDVPGLRRRLVHQLLSGVFCRRMRRRYSLVWRLCWWSFWHFHYR